MTFCTKQDSNKQIPAPFRGTKSDPRSSILDLQIHSEFLEEHVRVGFSKFQRFRKRLSLLVSLFRSH